MILEIEFDVSLKALIEIEDNEIKVLKAVDGWGNVINVNNVKIKKIEK